MVFIFVLRIDPTHVLYAKKFPPKTFQSFSIFRNLLQINGLRLNGFALPTLHDPSSLAPVHAVQIASLRVPFRHAQQPELLAEPRNRHALQRLRRFPLENFKNLVGRQPLLLSAPCIERFAVSVGQRRLPVERLIVRLNLRLLLF